MLFLILHLWVQAPTLQRCVTSCRPEACYYVEERECEYLTCEQLPKGSRCKPVVVNLGEWDPMPAPRDWKEGAYTSPPPDYGAYPTEKPVLTYDATP